MIELETAPVTDGAMLACKVDIAFAVFTKLLSEFFRSRLQPFMGLAFFLHSIVHGIEQCEVDEQYYDSN